MKEVMELEKMGYELSVSDGPEPNIRYQNPSLSAEPTVALFYLQRLKRNKNQAIAIIRANKAAQQFAEVYEQWCQDPDSANDADYVDQLAQIAIAGRMPFYEGGECDPGPDAWLRWADTFKKEVRPKERTVIGLPWEQGQ